MDYASISSKGKQWGNKHLIEYVLLNKNNNNNREVLHDKILARIQEEN